jgi:uncharacterized protein
MRTRAARLLRLAAPLGVLAITASLQAAGQPSFDCSRASKWAERTICDDDALAASDREMSAAYARQRAEAGDVGRKQLVSEQRRWLARREECRSDAAPAACLERMYHDRIVALGGRTDSAPTRPMRRWRAVATSEWATP